ncbi:MAG TPA: sulfotransferase [Gemmatimonadota bacterium]|nr:sulfotransferase [Gemmatimonadota bacterium]
MSVVPPLLVAGPGRSGTTLLCRLLALHPDLAWFSGWSARLPRWPAVAAIHRLNDWEALERRSRSWRRWSRAAEAYGCWDACFPGFSAAREDWGPDRVDPAGAERLRGMVAGHRRWQGKPGFMTKYTGWPRLEFMAAALPGSRVVWIDRDPRAVALSYQKQRWWYKRRPEAYAALSMRERVDFYAERYMEFWRARVRHEAGEEYLRVRYEDLVEDPEGVLSRICADRGLAWSGTYRRRVASYPIRRDANRATAARRPPVEWAAFGERLAGPLAELGFAPR